MSGKSVYFVSLGCPKNRVDTEVMLGLVDQSGMRIVAEPDQAEVIVVNTCGFIGEAKEESIDTILEMGRYKEQNCSRLVVTGCLSQRYAGDLSRELPEVDVFLGSADMVSIVRAVRGEIGGTDGIAGTPAWLYDDTTPRLASTARHSAYVKIGEGCDRPCSFCIIPKLRGPQRSRTPESVEREVRGLAEGGTVEVNLVAQDLTTYGTDLADEDATLPRLLRRLGKVSGGLRWLRLHYAYPTATSDELLDVIAGEERVAKYLDVPLQHIDDDLLKLMRRGHVGKTARGLVERARARVPGLTLRTTFIVGHPGETDEAFERLRAFVEESEFDRVGVFTYSKEDGTHSATLDEQSGAAAVPAKVAEQRRRELMRLQRTISKRKQKALVGAEMDVLVEGPSDESEFLLEGRHAGQAPEVDGKVFLSLADGLATDGAPRPGDVVRARVDSFADYDLAATALALVARAPTPRGRARLPIVVG